MFTEVLRATPLTQALVAGLGLGVVALQLGVAVAAREEIGWFYLPTVLLSFGLCAAVARMSSAVLVGPDVATLSMRLGGVLVWRRRLHADDVQRVERGVAGAMSAGGLGLRFLGGGRVALMVRHGDAVRIGLTDGYREYLVVTERPEELMTALTNLVATPR